MLDRAAYSIDRPTTLINLGSHCMQGDQASIIGGAINYAKELEQLLQSLEARKRHCGLHAAAAPLAAFFTFPQYAMRAANTALRPAEDAEHAAAASGSSRPSDVADIEVTMVESHANLKVLSRRRPRQVLRMVAGLQGHRLAVLHLNVTSAGPMALYSLSLKVLLLALAACRRSRPRFPRALHCIALSETTLAAIASGLDLPCRVVFNEADSARPGVSVLH